jgi:hypothetical protein
VFGEVRVCLECARFGTTPVLAFVSGRGVGCVKVCVEMRIRNRKPVIESDDDDADGLSRRGDQ